MQNAKLYPADPSRPASWRRFCAALALAAVVVDAPAAEPALAAAEALQWPVWVERDGSRRALAPGDALRASDRLSTGDGGKAMLRLADGSAVKLGENASLEIKGLRTAGDGALNAALDVAKGAFRFTTGLFRGHLRKRAVDIQVATVTAGIRGTDLWGKSDAQRDLVCLIEGSIAVAHPLGGTETMDRPLSFYVAPRGQAPGPVSTVDRKQLDEWAAETEVDRGAGVARSGGKWQVRLASVAQASEALALIDGAGELGVPVRAVPVADGDGFRYELRVRNLGSQAEAGVVAARLAAALKLTDVSVSR